MTAETTIGFDVLNRLAEHLCAPDAAARDGSGLPSGVDVVSRKPGGFLVACVTGAAAGVDAGRVAIKMDTLADSIRREHAAYEFLAARGLPTAPVLAHGTFPPPDGAVDTHGDPVESVAYLVIEWIEGHPVCSTDPVEVHREVGRVLRAVHDTPESEWEVQGCPPGFDRPGEMRPFGRWISGWLPAALHWWASTKEPDTDTLATALTWYDGRIQPEIADLRRVPVLFDGRPDHFIVNDGTLAGMIDLETVGLGDPVMDLGVLAANEPGILPGVLDGWDPTGEKRVGVEERIEFYMFLRSLAAAEFNTEQGDPALVPGFLKRAKILLWGRGL